MTCIKPQTTSPVGEGRVRSVEPAAFTKVSALGVEEQRVRVLIDITSPQPEWQALVSDGGRARQVRVQLGARNGNAAWVRSGLVPGQQVIVYPAATVRDGVRVSARKV